MSCSNECLKYKAVKPGQKISRYAAGQRYCSHCAVFMNIQERNCPCCHYQLKVKPTRRRHNLPVKRI